MYALPKIERILPWDLIRAIGRDSRSGKVLHWLELLVLIVTCVCAMCRTYTKNLLQMTIHG